MSRRWSSLVPVLAAAAVVALIGAVAVTVRSGDDTPRPLAISLASGGADAAAAPEAAGDSRLAYWGGALRLQVELSRATAEGRAYELGGRKATAEDVQRLGRALGVAGEPERTETGWQLVEGTKRLTVESYAGLPWWFNGEDVPVVCGPDTPVSSDASGASDAPLVRCLPPAPMPAPDAPATGGGSSGSSGSGSGSVEPVPPTTVVDPVPAEPTAEEQRAAEEQKLAEEQRAAEPAPLSPEARDRAAAAAGRLWSGLGVEIVNPAVYGGDERAMVTGTPRVDGLQTVGWAWSVDVDAAGDVLSASGWLATPTGADTYPLISQQAAFDQLSSTQPAMDLACRPGPADECLPAEQAPDRVVTGVDRGLMFLVDGNEQALLVPAWLFTIQDSPEPLAVVAVAPEHIVEPVPDEPTCMLPEGCDKPTTEPAPEPGTPEPAPEPGTPEPAPADRAAFSWDRLVQVEGATLVIGYGDSSSCPHENVVPQVKESPDSVVVVLEADAQPAERACTADYRAMEVKVELSAPLGNRQVIDGASGSPRTVEPRP